MRMLSLLIASILSGEPRSYLADIGPAPAVELTDSTGCAFRLDLLRGKVVLVSFVYTTCNGSCPATASKLDRLRRTLRDEGLWAKSVEFVSITLDPIHDTPEALARFASAYRAEPASWHFLTGSHSEVDRVLRSWDLWAKAGPSGVIDHPSRIFLLDPRGHQREIYSLGSLTPESVVPDIRSLLAEEAGSR